MPHVATIKCRYTVLHYAWNFLRFSSEAAVPSDPSALALALRPLVETHCSVNTPHPGAGGAEVHSAALETRSPTNSRARAQEMTQLLN